MPVTLRNRASKTSKSPKGISNFNSTPKDSINNTNRSVNPKSKTDRTKFTPKRTSTAGTPSSVSSSNKVRRSNRSTAGKSSRYREQSVASSSKASKKLALQPWETSDADDQEEHKAWGRVSSSEVDEDETDLFDESDKDSSDEEGSLFMDFTDYATTSSAQIEEEIFCPWAEIPHDQLPILELPGSSTDLLVDRNHLLDVLEIYEILQNFGSLIQLSPFLFEDFCCALRNSSQSNLIYEIHVAFIRLFFREEENEQTIFATTDTNLSFNVILQLLDNMNYAEVLRHYIESDPTFSRDVLHILENDNYPFVTLEKRLIVMKWMCEHFFETNIFKKMIKKGGKIKYDQHCRECGKAGGNLLPCIGCEAVYHFNCVGSEKLPKSEEEQQVWLCSICEKHQVRGATDCFLPGQSTLRKLPLGYDRNGRIYWFLVRRIFIYNPETNDIYYYSTLPQLYNLICALDSTLYERRLCEKLRDLLPHIAVQMHCSIELTDQRGLQLQEKVKKEIAKPYLHVDNEHLMTKIVADVKAEQESFGAEKLAVNGKINGQMEDNNDDENAPATNDENIIEIVRHLLCIRNGHLEAPFWSGGLQEDQLLINHYNWTIAAENGQPDILMADLEQRMRRGIRLGFSDAGFRNYINYYTTDDLSKSPYMRARERDRRRYLNSRFCITDEGEFTWPNYKTASSFGSVQEVMKCIQTCFHRRLIDRIPDGLMHRLWVLDNEKQRFLQRLQSCTDVETLRDLLLLFERALRKPVFLNIWWSGLALTKLIRTTSEDRERRQKMETLRRKEEKILQSADHLTSDSNIVWVKYSLFGGGLPKHNIWKHRDGNEQYRINGFNSLGGWLWISSLLHRNLLPLAQKPDNLKRPDSIATRKLNRLLRIDDKLLLWRTAEELNKAGKQANLICYSANCRRITSSCAIGSPALDAFCPYNFSNFEQGLLLPCYNSKCARNKIASDLTNRVVKAKPITRNCRQQECLQAGVLGEDIPFPFPKPYNFKRKSGKQTANILVLPNWCLKRLARQGGLNAQTIIPGFNQTAKANPQIWPYPCARPLFDHCWRFLTFKAKTLHAIALRFRILYASIRWMDMAPNPDDPDTRVWTHHPGHDEVRIIIGHKENPPEGYYEQYKVRVNQYSLEDTLNGFGVNDMDSADDKDFRHPTVREVTGPRKLRTRKRARPANESFNGALSERKHGAQRALCTIERWIDGVELKLFEIAEYWYPYLVRQLQNRQQQQQKLQLQQQRQQQQHVKTYVVFKTKQQQYDLNNDHQYYQSPQHPGTTTIAAMPPQQQRSIHYFFI